MDISHIMSFFFSWNSSFTLSKSLEISTVSLYSVPATDCLCSPKFIRQKLIPNVIDIWRWCHWEMIKSWGWRPHDWNYCLYKRTARGLSHPFHWGHSEKTADYESGSGPSPGNINLILVFLASEMWGINFCL